MSDHGTPHPPWLSIVMPVLNEAATLAPALDRLAPLRRQGVELLVVDGGSRDHSVALATPRCDRVLQGARGRGAQMNLGAAHSAGALLLFLHADTLLPPRAVSQLRAAVGDQRRVWGRFDVRLSGSCFPLRWVARLMNLRSALTGIATGDQGLFVSRALFEAVGGYAVIELMEDIELSRRLKRHSRPLCLPGPVVTSSRRWEQHGPWRTILLMWRLRLAYYLGVAPDELARRYRGG